MTASRSRQLLGGRSILYLSDRLGQRGGAGHHLLQVIATARRHGARVTVACGGGDRTAELAADVDVVRVAGLATAVASRSRLARLAALLAECDVVHLQNVMNPVAISSAVATGRTVVTVQDHRVVCPGIGKTLPDGSRCGEQMSELACSRCLDDAAYRSSALDLTRARRDVLAGARLVTLSRYMADELAAAGLPGAEVIPPWFEPGPVRSVAGDRFLLGGRLVHHKAVLDAWRAWRLAGRPLPLRIAGSGPLGSRLHGAELLGWLPAQDLLGELAACRALLFPGRWQEPFGILGVEALAVGTPVVVAASGGVAEWCDAGCLVVERGDVAGMAAAISRLAEDPELACGLGEEGRSMVARRFARSSIEARLLELYRSVIDKAARAAGYRDSGDGSM